MNDRPDSDQDTNGANDRSASNAAEQALALQAERAARTQSEERFHLLAENVSEVFWFADPEFHSLLYISPAFEKVWGFPAADIMKNLDLWLASMHPDDREWVERSIPERNKRHTELEYRIIRPDGAVRWINDQAFPVRDENGKVYRLVGTSRDITERKKAELDLRERVKEQACLYRALELSTSDEMPIGEIYRKIADLLTVSLFYVEDVSARIIIGEDEYKSEDWRKPVSMLRSAVTIGDDLEKGYVEVGYNREYPPPPRQSGLFLREEQTLVDAIARHIGNMLEARRLTETLRQTERLGAIGELTGGVAHDFNNLLTVILGNTEILVEQLREMPKQVRLVALIQTAAERGAELINRLLAFARRQALDPEVVQINSLLRDMEDLLVPVLGAHIEIHFDLDDDLWPSFIDSTQLESAILNLCINARDAMPTGGKLTLETANVRLDEDYADLNPDVAAGDYVMIAVSDTGCGMSAEVTGQAFDPFFTTKDVGKGSGLGLSMVYGFIKQSRGHVKIYSELEQGTTVKLYLPRTHNKGVLEEPSRSNEIPLGNEKILLVEDNELVRHHVTHQLEDLGYDVIIATNGPDALDLLERQGPVDLLFTDVVMPGGINGPALAEQAKKIQPGLPVLFTSGYTENAIVHHGRLDPGVDLLQKPYRRQDLAHKIRTIFDRV